jgi:hypothetical protein
MDLFVFVIYHRMKCLHLQLLSCTLCSVEEALRYLYSLLSPSMINNPIYKDLIWFAELVCRAHSGFQQE